MNSLSAKILTVATLFFGAGLFSLTAFAHGGGALMDAESDTATFTGLARISCFDDGNGEAASLIARIRDNSLPTQGLFVNVQLLKGTRAISITDTVSGDADYSSFIELEGGKGTYFLIINKTDAGARDIELEWHCLTADKAHTGTDIIGDQWE